MKIKVKYTEPKYEVGFLFGRMYVRNLDTNRVETSYCPHINLGIGECWDCSLVIETEEDY